MKLCRLHRTLAGCLPDVRLAVRLAARHARHCLDCQAHFAALEIMDRQLDSPASSVPEPLPDRWREQILTTVRRTPAQHHLERTAEQFGGWRLAAGAIAAGVVALMLYARLGSAPDVEADPLRLASDWAPALRQVSQRASWSTLAHAAEQPLNAEMTNTLHGSQLLLAGMVQSVLPPTAAEAVMQETGEWFGTR